MNYDCCRVVDKFQITVRTILFKHDGDTVIYIEIAIFYYSCRQYGIRLLGNGYLGTTSSRLGLMALVQ